MLTLLQQYMNQELFEKYICNTMQARNQRCWQQINIWCPLTALNFKYNTNDSNELVCVLIWLLNWSCEIIMYLN